MGWGLNTFLATLLSQWTWIMFYVVLLLLVIKNNKTILQILLIVLSCVVIYFASFASYFECALALFFILLTRSMRLSVSMILWAFTLVAARVVLGDSNIMVTMQGVGIGIAIGLAMYLVCDKLNGFLSPRCNYISTYYTSTGYAIADLDICVSVLSMTYIYALIKATII